ncbi:KTSC domain-containing protein [Paracoccus jiaweipingae]|uniref:KTSC domain-containing protein n=1 Tax=unclassified Paracoccus (in: a-proteobacteria) TaxID=2688777 RepID=UPI00379FE8DA
MPFVSPSATGRIAWGNGTLLIWFRQTGRCDCSGVPEDVYHAFLTADPEGGVCNRYIKDPS